MKESRKEFIKKAHENACSEWKTNIEKEFPKLFKEDALVIGKWYKSNEGHLVCVKKINGLKLECFGFGVWPKKWSDSLKWSEYNFGFTYTLAYKTEVTQALIKEAKKRGFKKGVYYECLWEKITKKLEQGDFYHSRNELWFCGAKIFDNGKWATIIETITKEQAEKELGKTIIN